MNEINRIFEEALIQTWKDFKACALYDIDLKEKIPINKFKNIYLPLYEMDAVIRVAHNLLNNKQFSRFAIFSNYHLYDEKSGHKRYEDIIIQDKTKVHLELNDDLMPKSSKEELDRPVEIVAELKVKWRDNREKIKKMISDEIIGLNEIKKEGYAKEVYLVIFTYLNEDIRDLEKEYPGIKLKIFPLNVNVLLNK